MRRSEKSIYFPNNVFWLARNPLVLSCFSVMCVSALSASAASHCWTHEILLTYVHNRGRHRTQVISGAGAFLGNICQVCLLSFLAVGNCLLSKQIFHFIKFCEFVVIFVKNSYLPSVCYHRCIAFPELMATLPGPCGSGSGQGDLLVMQPVTM